MPSTERASAYEIFNSVIDNAREELSRSTRALACSGLAAGLAMGLTGVGVAVAHVALRGSAQEFVPYLLYPVGFMVVIVGRQQLFTENTLYPVALVLDERRRQDVINTARLWVTVFVTNIVGAALFALLAGRGHALRPDAVHELVRLGAESTGRPYLDVFASAIVGGWIIALLAWLVTAADWTIGHVAVVWVLAFVVGLGHFAHCIASSGEILTGVWRGDIGLGSYGTWLAVATAGNIVGGIVIVTLLNFGQVTAGGERERRTTADPPESA
jgi:formate/nitrite transporter FocA (FNT family)